MATYAQIKINTAAAQAQPYHTDEIQGIGQAVQDICDNLSAASSKAFAHSSLSVDQISNFTVGNHVQFEILDFVQGGITISTGVGQADGIFSLPAGKTYNLMGTVSANFSGAGSYNIDLQWRIVTGGLIGKIAHIIPQQSTAKESAQPIASAMITTVGITQVQLETVAITGTATQFYAANSFARITEI